jgi:hypothetical protein
MLALRSFSEGGKYEVWTMKYELWSMDYGLSTILTKILQRRRLRSFRLRNRQILHHQNRRR